MYYITMYASTTPLHTNLIKSKSERSDKKQMKSEMKGLILIRLDMNEIKQFYVISLQYVLISTNRNKNFMLIDQLHIFNFPL